tara:strand:- start:1022 stop:1456 length:435 start_codon:yes stop_codon:yes gene_type:complete
MIKKIIKLFKKKNNKKKIKKQNKETAKIINFVNNSKKKNRIQTEQMEKKKIDNIAQEIVENFYNISKKSFLDMAYCFYLLLYRVMQRMIFHTSFPIYRHYHRTASKQIIENHKVWLHEYKEWENAPTSKINGEKKLDNENDTLH